VPGAEPGPQSLSTTGITLRGAYGIRTRAAAVRGRCPRPLDECARRGGSLADQIRSPITRRTRSREVIRFGAEAQSVGRSVVTPRPSNEGPCSRPKGKKTLRVRGFFVEAAGLGFEPRLLGPEPSVLPLDDPAKGEKSLATRFRGGSSGGGASPPRPRCGRSRRRRARAPSRAAWRRAARRPGRSQTSCSS
jgi:hypothetical protein